MSVESKFTFLTPEWIDAARALHEEYRGRLPQATLPAKVNLVVRDVPFSDDHIHAHLETAPGSFEVELGHLEAADATVTLDYATTLAVFVEANAQAGMQAYMSGRIRVEGDVAKLITVFGGMGGSDPMEGELADRLREITEIPASTP